MTDRTPTRGKLDSAPVAAARLDEVRALVAEAREREQPLGLATVLVGDDPGSRKYVEMKQRESTELGIESHDVRLPGDISQERLEDELRRLDDRADIDAILVQYPLPGDLDYMQALLTIDPTKDVDGLHPVNLGLLTAGEPRIVPGTPRGILDLLEWHAIELRSKRVVVVGRGMTVGRPLSVLLSSKRGDTNATVTVAHTGSREADLRAAVEQAEVVIGAAGSPGLIQPEWLVGEPVIVAAGVSFPEGKAVSDFAPGCRERASAWTPTTGGVGPMTRAWLFVNVTNCRRLRTP